MNYEDIGKFIQEKRKEKGLTQKELAKKIGVTDKAVSKWETGAGCPDVSLLESLSKELDCSILEILKGRNISSVDVVEMDNYIKDTIDYSKNKYKIIINKFITFLIIFIVILLLIFNIINIGKQRIKKNYDYVKYSSTPYKNEILENISIIRNNKGNYQDDDYQKIITNLDKIENNIKRNVLLNYQDEKIRKLSFNDLYVLNASSIDMLPVANIYNIINKYQNVDDYLTLTLESYITSIYMSDLYNQNRNLYQYGFTILPIEEFFNRDTYVLLSRYSELKLEMHYIKLATELVMEAGGINE